LRDWSFVFLLVHAKQRRTSLKRDDEHEAAAAMFCLLCCTLFVWCVCVCVCVYQCVLVMKTNATAASAISPYPRSNNDSGCRSAKTDVVGPAATNERTNAGERARTPPLLRSVCPTNERAGGRARARRCGACVHQPTNKCAGARNRRCCDGFAQRSQM